MESNALRSINEEVVEDVVVDKGEKVTVKNPEVVDLDVPSEGELTPPEDAHRKKGRKLKTVQDYPTKKKNIISRFIGGTVKSINWEGLGSEVMDTVIVPNLKALACNACVGVIENIFLGKPISNQNMFYTAGNVVKDLGSTMQRRSVSNIDYTNRYRPQREVKTGVYQQAPGNADIEFDSYMDAKEVLRDSMEQIRRSSRLRVSELYTFAGIQYSSQDTHFGWTDINNAYIGQNDAGKWILHMPRSREL
jgi:hypothetical protein